MWATNGKIVSQTGSLSEGAGKVFGVNLLPSPQMSLLFLKYHMNTLLKQLHFLSFKYISSQERHGK